MVLQESRIRRTDPSRQRSLPAQCHPELRWHARGLCSACYRNAREAERLAGTDRKARGQKFCHKCNLEKPLGEFYRSGRRVKSYCKPCHRDSTRIYTHNRLSSDPQYLRIRTESNRKSKILTGRRSRLIRQYGLRPEDYDALLDRQGGVCAVCLEPAGDMPLHVDHDHECCPGPDSCGKCIRGLLHARCNQGLGMFSDDPSLLEMAAQYLRRTKATPNSAVDNNT